MEECLCIKCRDKHFNKVWVMKKYNEKQSWEVVDNCQIKCYYPYYNPDYYPYYDPYYIKLGNDTFTSNDSSDYYPYYNIMESLVSPHLQPDNE